MRPSDWLIADDLHGRREYVVHRAAPRFIARLVDDEREDYNPGGVSLRLDDGQSLVEFEWIDPAPDHARLIELASEVRMALAFYEERLEADVEGGEE